MSWATRQAALRLKACKRCDSEFKPNSGSQMYCDGCRMRQCPDCGGDFPKNRNKRCDRCRRGKRCGREPAPFGSTRPDAYGYVRFKVGVGYHRADPHGWVLEHVYVWQEAYGLVDRKQQIHHINGDKADNRLENLQLRQGPHGSGRAVRCRDCGSTNVESVPL